MLPLGSNNGILEVVAADADEGESYAKQDFKAKIQSLRRVHSFGLEVPFKHDKIKLI
jgi:hypothetical protein